MRHVLFVFIDGLGLGSDDAAINPLSRYDLPGFESLCGRQKMTESAGRVVEANLLFSPIDANLGVEGLPQSGTGQASIFTGINCAALAGRHYGPYPHSTSSDTITNRNIFTRLIKAGIAITDELTFANTYPSRFFKYVKRTNRWTVTTRCCVAAGIRIRSTSELSTGDGIAADVTGAGLQVIDRDVKPITEEEAADNLLRLGEKHRFTLFEFFHTDKAGHSMSFERSQYHLLTLDRFLSHLREQLNMADGLLLLTSDHGNIEDLSTKSHTRNRVPFIAYGASADHFKGVDAIDQIVEPLVAWYSL